MAETVLRVEHVGMRFNLSKERVDSLKDYILKSITRQMKFDEFWALKDINFTLEKRRTYWYSWNKRSRKEYSFEGNCRGYLSQRREA